MRRCVILTLVSLGTLVLSGVAEVAAKDPIFVRWMVADDPGDQVILDYWQRSEQDELDAEGLVDLGTLLFHRGYPKDAIRYFRLALKKKPEMAEAWYRIGVVEHKQGNLRRAREAYRKCLRRSSGHGWGNFYLGLLEEQTNHPSRALEHFQIAFRHAPELADPKINPEVLQSKLYLGALVVHKEERRFGQSVPMPLLDPAEAARLKARADQERAASEAAAERQAKDELTAAQESAKAGKAVATAETATTAATAEATAKTVTAAEQPKRQPSRRRMVPSRTSPKATPTPSPQGGSSNSPSNSGGGGGQSGRPSSNSSGGSQAPRVTNVSPEG